MLKSNEQHITIVGDCPDCGTKDVLVAYRGKYKGLCHTCRRRKIRAKYNEVPYVPFIDLSINEKQRVVNARFAQTNRPEYKMVTFMSSNECLLQTLEHASEFEKTLNLLLDPSTPKDMVAVKDMLNKKSIELYRKCEECGYEELSVVKAEKFFKYKNDIMEALIFFENFYKSCAPIELQKFLNKYYTSHERKTYEEVHKS